MFYARYYKQYHNILCFKESLPCQLQTYHKISSYRKLHFWAFISFISLRNWDVRSTRLKNNSHQCIRFPGYNCIKLQGCLKYFIFFVRWAPILFWKWRLRFNLVAMETFRKQQFILPFILLIKFHLKSSVEYLC